MTRLGYLLGWAIVAFWLSPGPALAAEGGLLNLDRSLIIQAVNFLLLLLLLYRFLYRPLLRALESRSAAIKEQLEEAQAAREGAQRQLADSEARLREARAEAQAAREAAQREAQELRERLTAQAREEASRLVASARAEIEQDVRRAKAELREEVGDLAVAIAERLIRQSLRGDDHRRLVEEALARLERS